MQHRESPSARINPSGKRVFIARYTAADGRRRSAGTFELKRDAQAAIDAAYIQPPTRDTVGDYHADWTNRHPRSERTDRTNNHRISRALNLPIEARPLKDWPLSDLRRKHALELFGLLLTEQGRSVGGARNILRALSAMCEDAVTDEILAGNPFKGVRVRENDRRATKQPRVARVWSFEEMHRFAAHAGEWEPMVRTLADCGLRVGELFALERQLQDLRGGVFRVTGSAWNGQVLPSSSTKRHDRSGPIPPGCLTLLRAMTPRIDSPWLFCTPGGRRVGTVGRDRPGGCLWRLENWYRQVWRPAQVASGLWPTPQEFRSSFNTHLLAAGIDRADLADVLGHSESVNADRYTRALRRSGEAIKEVIG